MLEVVLWVGVVDMTFRLWEISDFVSRSLVFFLNKKKQFPIIASLLENPLSGFHYPLMRRILCVIGLGGRSVYPITDTPTLR